MEAHQNGFGLAHIKREGYTNIDLDGFYYIQVNSQTLEAIGLRHGRRGWTPRKLLDAFIAGAKTAVQCQLLPPP